MSEFKFACPFCGQHLTAAPQDSGTRIDCPTCFQKMIVPQAPTGNDSKLILSAAKADRPRPTSAVSDLAPLRRSGSRGWLASAALLIAVGICAAVAYAFRAELGRAFGLRAGPAVAVATNEPPIDPGPQAAWTLDPAKVVIPERVAYGRIHGREFVCERATLHGGSLTLRQGHGWPPALGLQVLLSAQRAEQLAGKNIIIAPGANSVVSKIIVHWQDEQQRASKEDITRNYALTLLFGQVTEGVLPGKVHVSLPDKDQSFVAGTFEAEIVKPRQTKTAK